ncbi:MAG: hypothetical protein WBB31_19000 [Saprospiraceae bacterium]
MSIYLMKIISACDLHHHISYPEIKVKLDPTVNAVRVSIVNKD